MILAVVARTNVDNTLYNKEVDQSCQNFFRISTHEGCTLSPQMPADSMFFVLRDTEISYVKHVQVQNYKPQRTPL